MTQLNQTRRIPRTRKAHKPTTNWRRVSNELFAEMVSSIELLQSGFENILNQSSSDLDQANAEMGIKKCQRILKNAKSCD